MIAEVHGSVWVFWTAVFCLSTCLDALYCGMETGCYVLNKVRLDLQADAGQPRARYLQGLVNDYNKLLSVLLLGTNVMRYIATLAVTNLFILAGLGHRAEWLTLAIATPVLFILADAVPKQVFQRVDDRTIHRIVPMLRVSTWVYTVTGLVPLVRSATSALLRLTGAHRAGRAPLESAGVHAAIAEGQASGILSHFQTIMADRVMHITEVTVGDAMRPMRSALTAPADTAREAFVELIRRHNHSRVPLTDDSGRVVGVVDIYEFLAGDADLAPADAARPPFRLGLELQLTDALYRMQHAHRHMAIVTDGAARDVGLVTLKDLVEEIVGELQAW